MEYVWKLLEKSNLNFESIEKYVGHVRIKILKILEGWKETLARNIALRNPEIKALLRIEEEKKIKEY